MMINETEHSFYLNLFLPVQIIWDIEKEGEIIGKKCWLDNGLDGFISLKNCTENFFHTLKSGVVVNAKLIEFEFDRFTVKLECRWEEI